MRASTVALTLFAALASAQSTLNITALTGTGGPRGKSIFECWALQPGFASSNQTGTAGALKLELGNLANASYSIIPPFFNAGLHNAPAVQ